MISRDGNFGRPELIGRESTEEGQEPYIQICKVYDQ